MGDLVNGYNLLGMPSCIALFQARPASVGMQATPVMIAKEGRISHHILINRRHSETTNSFFRYHWSVQLELAHIVYSGHRELQCLKPNVDILDHMRGCHWVAHHKMLCGIALLRLGHTIRQSTNIQLLCHISSSKVLSDTVMKRI